MAGHSNAKTTCLYDPLLYFESAGEVSGSGFES